MMAAKRHTPAGDANAISPGYDTRRLLETHRPWFMSWRVCGANLIPENILTL
tara:strand:- start:1 stop:156 length:156 start_codon:yes stop_codon:yes gene_type:complete